MTVEIESSPMWDAQLCSMFAGIILYSKDPELSKLATKNFLRLYKLLSTEQKQLLRDSIRFFKEDPSSAFNEQIDMINDAKESGLLDDINKDAL